MRVVITGGTGLIGRKLAASLVQDGHEVIILTRDPRRARVVPAGVRLEQWDGRSADGWGELVNGAAALINLAGEPLGGSGFFPPRWTAGQKQKIRDSRIHAAQACAAAIQSAEHKPNVLIQASAIGFYGPHEDEILTEASPAGSDFAAQVCQEWEASTAAVSEQGVRHVVLRTGLVIDKSGGILMRLALPFRFFAGGPIGNGKQWLSWIHIDDQIAAIRFLLQDKSATGPFNLTAPNPVQNKEFARALGRAMHRLSFMPAPAFAFKAAFGEVATLVLDGQRVLPQKLKEAGFKFSFETLEPALTNLFQNK